MRLRYVPQRTTVVLAVCALLCMFLPAAGSPVPAAAAGPLSLSPSTANPGQTVTAVGCGFPVPIGAVSVNILGYGPVSVSNVNQINPADCDSMQFTVPATLSAASYTVNVTAGATIDSGTLTVSSSSGTLVFNPSTAISGQTVTASGCGFPAGASVATVSITIGGIATSASSVAATGAAGCYEFAFAVPSLASGSYTVSIYSGGVTDSGILPVNSTTTGALSFSPNPAGSGQSVTASGCGFPTGASVATVSISNYGVVATTSVAPTATSGCYSITFTLPTLAAGSYTVSVSIGNMIETGTLQVGTTGALTFMPNPASSGQMVTASGCGFITASGIATVNISGYGAVTATGVTAGSTAGCFNVTFAVPTLAAGSYTVTVTIGNVTDSGTLGVNTAVAPGTLTLSPSVAVSGQQVTANGCGYGTSDTLVVTIYASTTLVASPALTSTPVYSGGGVNGTVCYSVTFTVPTLPNGSYTVRLTGSPSGNVDSGTLTVGATSGTSLSAAPSIVVAGTAVTLSGSGYSAGAQVTITAFGATQLVTASASGTFTATVSPPAGTAPGSYTVSAVDSTGKAATATITVTASAAALTPSVTAALPGQVITVTGTGFAPNEQVSLSLGAPSATPFAIAGTIQLYTANASGTISGVQYTVPNIAPGSYLLLALGQTSRVFVTTAFTVLSTATATPTATPIPPTPTATPTPQLSLPTVSTAATTTYFASGYTGTAAVNGKVTFTERLFFYNPGSAPSTVTTTYAVYNSTTRVTTTITKQDVVASGGTVSRLVNADVGNDRIVSATVRATSGIVAEEMVSRTRADGTILDADSSLGSPALSTIWNLAEGYTGESLQEYITLYNPGTATAHAQVQYLPTGDTPAPPPQAETVPPNSQVTINVRSQYNALVPKGSRNIAAQISSDLPIAVDRAMYWGDGSGSAKYGYSLAPAIASGAQRQYFALLPTSSGSQSFVTVLNPNIGAASVTLSLLNASGATIRTASATLNGHARYTFVVPSLLPGDHGNLSGGLLSSSAPVVAEAALYFGGSPNIGSHPGTLTQGSPGAPTGARADVSPRGGLLRVFNPGTTAARVQVSLGGAAGSSVVFDSTVPANGSQEISLPGTGAARGVVLLASGSVVATLINGGIGVAQVWGGSLN